MFTSQMVESQKKSIELHGVSKVGLKAVIDYIYTGECEKVAVKSSKKFDNGNVYMSLRNNVLL